MSELKLEMCCYHLHNRLGMCADHMFHMDVRPQRISALRLNDTTQRVTDRHKSRACSFWSRSKGLCGTAVKVQKASQTHICRTVQITKPVRRARFGCFSRALTYTEPSGSWDPLQAAQTEHAKHTMRCFASSAHVSIAVQKHKKKLAGE